MDDLSPEELDRLTDALGGETAQQTIDQPAGQQSNAASQAVNVRSSGQTITRAQFMQLEEALNSSGLPPQDIDRMSDVQVQVEVVLGSTRMALEEVLKLNTGSVVELNKLAGEPVEILVNSRLIARAEVVVIEDNFGVKVLEIVGTKQKLSAIQD